MDVRTSLPITLLAVAATACSASAGNPTPPAPQPTQLAAAQPAGDLPRLVFFMNPNGVPCQLQDRVLREMAPELSGRAAVVRYRTTEQGDLAWFGRYGVRSLPMLIVTDAAGAEVRRATPGIHSAEDVRQLLATP